MTVSREADTGPTEVELKLRIEPEGLAQIRASHLMAAQEPAPPKRLAATYFDTDDRRLAARGIALRIRREGRRKLQTLKTAGLGSSVLADRGEWEMSFKGDVPDLAAFGDPRVLTATGLVLPDELQAIFTTRIARETVPLAWPDEEGEPALIEIAFDQGRIEVPGKRLPVSELELELRHGHPSAIFMLLRELRRLTPVAIEPLTKGQRGDWLASGEPPPPRKASRVTLADEMTAEDALQVIARSCLAHWSQNEVPARIGSDIEGVHQLRVALRRLRSILSLFSSILDPVARGAMNDRLRTLLQQLGPARDLDVFDDELLAPLRADPEMGPELAPLEALLQRQRQAAYASVRRTLSGREHADLLVDMLLWVELRGWREGAPPELLEAQRQPIHELADKLLTKRYRRVRKRGRGFARLSAEARHELRIAVKKLRYGLDFFADLYEPRATKRFASRLGDLQDRLGGLNDIATARHLTQQLLAAAPPEDVAVVARLSGVVTGWYGANSRQLLAEAEERWDTFRETDPCFEEARA